MSAKETPILTLDLTSEERRIYVNAAKELVRLSLTVALARKGVAVQNFSTWCKGQTSSLGVEKQHAMLSLFGLTPHGQLMPNYTHSWRVVGRENASFVSQLLTRETKLTSVSLAYAYASLTHTGGEIGLVGVEANWKGPYFIGTGVQQRPRRLIMTAAPGSWLDDDFKQWVYDLFNPRLQSCEAIYVDADYRVSISAANNIWRWNAKARDTDGSRLPAPKPKGLLPIKQDLVGESNSTESALDVLQDMTPRLMELAKRNATARGTAIAPHDKALIRRAKAALNDLEDQH